MKKQNSGVMVSFTIGFVAGLYATSQETRHWIQERTHRYIQPRRKRHIIDIVEVDDLQ